MQNQYTGYRPDIDGLRAIAVLAVIANHLPADYLPSGFLGVDIFFVISGYVVTASSLKLKGSSFSNFYTNFLARRVKRLAPALITCVTIISLAVILLDTHPGPSLHTGLASLFGFANILLYINELDYFAPASKLNAFTHTWSLGVEEQFYVLFPLILWLTKKKKSAKDRSALVVVLALFSLLSAVGFLALYEDSQNAAYYLIPFRFWELGLGCLTYLATQSASLERRFAILSYVSPASLAALLACFFIPQTLASSSTPSAVVLTTIVLVAPMRSFSRRLLAVKPAVYIGKISYSLYLWHWPVVALAPLALAPEWRGSSILLPCILFMAMASYYLVEKPLRNRTWSATNLRDITYGFSASGVVALLLLGAMKIDVAPSNAIKTSKIFPQPHLNLYASDLSYQTCVVDEQRPLATHTFESCLVEPLTSSGLPRVWAIGDSHTVHLQAMLYELHQKLGMGVSFIATPGRPYPALSFKRYPPQEKIFGRVIKEAKTGDILLISRLAFQRNVWPPQVASGFSHWAQMVSELAKELHGRGINVVVTGPPPIFNFNDIRECSLTARKYCGVERKLIQGPVDQASAILHALEPGVRVFDIAPVLCPQTQEYCYPDDGSVFLFQDADHFNVEGASRLTVPFIKFLADEGLIEQVDALPDSVNAELSN